MPATKSLNLGDNHSSIVAIEGETYAFRKRESRLARQKMWREWAQVWKGHAIIAEKTPKHVYHTAEIKQRFPRAVIIGITRDPFDNIASLKRRYEDLEKAVDRYEADNRELLAAEKAGRISLTIKYEDLIEDPRRILGQIVNQAGLECEPGMLANENKDRTWYTGADSPPSKPTYSRRTHTAYRTWQINQGLFDGRGSGTRLLTTEEFRVVAERLTGLARELGYAPNGRA